MEHLTREALARLVDESPGAEEARHLGACLGCSSELDALRAQTRALASLPEIRPPLGDWEVLEARLRSEGLVETPALLERLSLAHTPPWMRTAAAVALFMGGTGVGAALASGRPGGADPVEAVGQTALFTDASNLDDAAAAVKVAEENYINAVSQYRQYLSQNGEDDLLGDPRGRYAALEYLVAASQAAVRQAPADPFLNGLLASTLAEREATLRRISSSQDNWF
ncbi:MAG TPA: hypothetical protein VJ997_01080 [Longimicrobiales bacterium]|nr:hypothetical protein [Longimicrobiales bacterium]